MRAMWVSGSALVLWSMTVRAPDKILLRYRPHVGSIHQIRTESHFFLDARTVSGPRPEHIWRLTATDSVAGVDGDSVVQVLLVQSISRTDGDYATGDVGPWQGGLRVETTWTDKRVPRGSVRGTTSPQVLNHLLPDLLDGTAPFPDQPVSPDDSWKGEGVFHIVSLDSLGILKARIDTKLKAVSEIGADTIVVLHLKVKVEGPERFYRVPTPQTQKISGTLEGDERFSLSRGVTDSLSLAGTLFTVYDLGGGATRRQAVPTEVSLTRWSTPVTH